MKSQPKYSGSDETWRTSPYMPACLEEAFGINQRSLLLCFGHLFWQTISKGQSDMGFRTFHVWQTECAASASYFQPTTRHLSRVGSKEVGLAPAPAAILGLAEPLAATSFAAVWPSVTSDLSAATLIESLSRAGNVEKASETNRTRNLK